MFQSIISHLRANWLDLLAFLVLGIGASVGLDWLSRAESTMQRSGHDILGLALFISMLVGFARAAVVNYAAWLFLRVGWPTLATWGDSKWFKDRWQRLTNWQQHLLFVLVACSEGIIVALCFLSGGGK